MPISNIKVMLVNDDDLFGQNPDSLLEGAEDIKFVGQTKTGWEAIDMIQQHLPHTILFAIGSASSDELKTNIRKWLSVSPGIKIIVTHRDDQKKLALEALRNGAVGHLGQEKLNPSELITTIRKVSRGGVVISPGIAGAILDEIIRKQDEKL